MAYLSEKTGSVRSGIEGYDCNPLFAAHPASFTFSTGSRITTITVALCSPHSRNPGTLLSRTNLYESQVALHHNLPCFPVFTVLTEQIPCTLEGLDGGVWVVIVAH